MLAWLRRMIEKYRDLIRYALLGILTTGANYLVYLPLFNIVGCSAAVSDAVAWIAAVLVAFVTNKPFVFHSNDWSAKTVLPEFCKFAGCRFVSGALEVAILFTTVDVLNLNGNIMKIAASILTIILNYFASKLFVFRKKEEA